MGPCVLGFDRGSACSLTVRSRPVDWRCEDAKRLQIATSLTPPYSFLHRA